MHFDRDSRRPACLAALQVCPGTLSLPGTLVCSEAPLPPPLPLGLCRTYLILRIVVQRLTGGKLDDIREDEEEEEAPATIEAAQQPAASAATQGSSVKQRRPVRVVAS